MIYKAFDGLMTKKLPEIELYSENGKLYAEERKKRLLLWHLKYLNKHYPDVKRSLQEAFAECGIFIVHTLNRYTYIENCERNI